MFNCLLLLFKMETKMKDNNMGTTTYLSTYKLSYSVFFFDKENVTLLQGTLKKLLTNSVIM